MGFQRNVGTPNSGSPTIGFGSITTQRSPWLSMSCWWKSPLTSVVSFRCLVIRLIVLDGHDLEDGVLPGERDEREPARDETLTQGNTPVARDLRRRGA